MDGIRQEDLADVGVDAQLYLLRAQAKKLGVSLPVYLNQLSRATGGIGRKAAPALPYVSKGFTGKEIYDLVTDEDKVGTFRRNQEELKQAGIRGGVPRVLSIVANPVTAGAAVSENVGGALADVYLRNFRPDLLPENYSETSVPTSIKKTARENALKEIYAKAEEEADQYPSLEDAYREVMSDEDKSSKFKKPKVELR